MSARKSSAAEPTARAGWFSDPCAPGTHRRYWDGEAWTQRTTDAEAAADNVPAEWQRHPFAFFTHRWFHIVLIGLAAGIVGTVVFSITEIRPVLVITTVVFAILTMIAFGSFVDGRLRLGRVVARRPVVLVAVVGGVIGFGIAYGVETGLALIVPVATITGPVEEFAKLMVPVALYLAGRYRNPRAGLAIAMASAAGFGVVEAALYAGGGQIEETTGTLVADSVVFGILRPLFVEPLHVLWTGAIAVTAWRTWHMRHGFHLTAGVLGVLFLAMGLHSLNDTLLLGWGKGWAALVIPIWVVTYFLFKFTAREQTPPDAIASVPPGWRPHWLRSVTDAGDASAGPVPKDTGAASNAARAEAAATDPDRRPDQGA